MKKFAAVCSFVLVALAIWSPVANAAVLRVAVTAPKSIPVSVASRAPFAVRASRPASVKLVIYKGRIAIRTIRPAYVSSEYTLIWNQRDAKGRVLLPGLYGYRVTVSAQGRSAVAAGSVRRYKPSNPVKPTTPTIPKPPVVTTPVVTTPTIGTTPPVDATTPVVPTTPTEATVPTGTPPPVVTPPVITPPPVAPPTTSSDRWLGFFIPGAPTDMSLVAARQSSLGAHAAVIHWFISDSESFPLSRCQKAASNDSIPLVTLEFWAGANNGVASITSGSKDAYLQKFADDAKAYGGEVWLRPFHEMNGDWYPWGGSANGNSAAAVVAAWKHVKDIFTARGATNVKFVWCPNNDSVPATTGNAISAYWPGDAYVDYVAIDGYNAGDTQSWSTWRPFASCFSASYSTITKLTAKPLFIAETSSLESGGSKAAWITAMFQSIKTSLPRIRGVVWFDNKTATNDWRIDSSASSLGAFKAAAAAGF